jgi:hypothetical protein
MADPDPESSPDAGNDGRSASSRAEPAGRSASSRAEARWAEARWRKSSHSPDGPPGCLEWAPVGDRVGVRNSNHPTGGMLVFGRPAWTDFIAGVKLGEFDA